MSPLEAAALLGVHPAAPRDDVLRAYDALSRSTAPGDVQRQDALARARDALLASAPWQPPGVAPAAWQAPAAPGASGPYPAPAAPVPGDYPAPAPGYGAGVPSQQVPSYPPPAAWWAPPAPPRRGLSTGAIIGIVLGGAGALLVVTIVAIVFLVAAVHRELPAVAVPPSAQATAPATDDPTDDEPFDLDGFQVQYTGDWTYRITSQQGCAEAVVSFNFSTTSDGEADDVWSEVARLDPGVPHDIHVPYSASQDEYVTIESITCGTT